MRRLILIIPLLIFCILSGSGQAHEGHWDGMGLDEVIDEAKLQINKMVDEKLLSESWKQSKFNYDQTEGLVEIQGKRRWVLAYTNSLEKQTISITFTPMGKFIGFEFIETKKLINKNEEQNTQ